MTDDEKIQWLRDLYSLLTRNKNAEFSYTTSDDGVWLSFGEAKADSLNLGYDNDSARTAIFEFIKVTASNDLLPPEGK